MTPRWNDINVFYSSTLSMRLTIILPIPNTQIYTLYVTYNTFGLLFLTTQDEADLYILMLSILTNS